LIDALTDGSALFTSWMSSPRSVSSNAAYALIKIDPEAARKAAVP
jgi:hypothetical protein